MVPARRRTRQLQDDRLAWVPGDQGGIGPGRAGRDGLVRVADALGVGAAAYVERVASRHYTQAFANGPKRLSHRAGVGVVSGSRHIVCRGMNRNDSDCEEQGAEWHHNKAFELSWNVRHERYLTL